jgi:hypothetical protein
LDEKEFVIWYLIWDGIMIKALVQLFFNKTKTGLYILYSAIYKLKCSIYKFVKVAGMEFGKYC